jgi:hypothetical protein
MRQDVPNIDLLPIEMNRGNQAVLVPANIEDHQIVYHICAAKDLMEIMITGKMIHLHDPKPESNAVRLSGCCCAKARSALREMMCIAFQGANKPCELA